MPATREIIMTIKQLQDLAAEKPVKHKRVYLQAKYGNISPVFRIDPTELTDLSETLVRMHGKDVTPEDVGLAAFAIVDRIESVHLKHSETVVFLSFAKSKLELRRI